MLELGVCYYPEQWSKSQWRSDAKKMVALGVRWVRIAEFTWSSIEPHENHYTWQWLDEVIQILGEEGLDIVMCTPSAAPPKWLVDRDPSILPVDKNGVTRQFGARRHYCFSSQVYLRESARICAAYAKRYGANKYVKAWQIDNEYGDHNSSYSYSQDAKEQFRVWLKNRYHTIDTLNDAWGASFWSTHYNSFEDIELANNMVDAPSPGHSVDFIEFSSDQICHFNQQQVDIVRKYAQGSPITHNFMAHNSDFDHYKLGKSLDFASWDSYPMGALVHSDLPDETKQRWLRTGIPDQPSFYHDLYRHVGKGKVWVMEQQPGPVNWAQYNQSPADGMVRLWTWLAYAHGVDVVCYFRWRQAKFAQEQLHTGVLLSNSQPDQCYYEMEQVVAERKLLPEPGERQAAKVAIIFDYPSLWASETLPLSGDYSGVKNALYWYSAVQGLGVDIDVIGPDANLDSYQLIIIPDMMMDNEKFSARLAKCPAKVLIGPRTASNTPLMHIPDDLAPGSFQAMLDVKVTRVESLPPYVQESVSFKGQSYPLVKWRETLQSSAQTLASYEGDYRAGQAAIVGNDRYRYCGLLLRDQMLVAVMEDTLHWAGLATTEFSEDLRVTRRGKLNFAFNFSQQSQQLNIPTDAKIYLGSANIEAIGVTIWSAS